jgi:hypothetical protein
VRFEDSGEAGLLDRRLGQASDRRVPAERQQQIETLYRTRHSGFTAKHFHEHLVREDTFSWGYHLAQGVPAIEGAAATRQDARRTPAQAAAPAVAGNDAASGWLAA